MSIKIGGDMLAMDASVRHQIETEAQKLCDRFPGENFTQQVYIQEEFDQVRGHRIRCELTLVMGSGRQLMLRDTSKDVVALIESVYANAKRGIFKARKQDIAQSDEPIVYT